MTVSGWKSKTGNESGVGVTKEVFIVLRKQDKKKKTKNLKWQCSDVRIFDILYILRSPCLIVQT